MARPPPRKGDLVVLLLKSSTARTQRWSKRQYVVLTAGNAGGVARLDNGKEVPFSMLKRVGRAPPAVRTSEGMLAREAQASNSSENRRRRRAGNPADTARFPELRPGSVVRYATSSGQWSKCAHRVVSSGGHSMPNQPFQLSYTIDRRGGRSTFKREELRLVCETPTDRMV